MIHTHGKWNPSDPRIVFAPGNGAITVFSDRCEEANKNTDCEELFHRSQSVAKGVSKLYSLLSIYPGTKWAAKTNDAGWKKQIDEHIHWHERFFLDSGVFGLAAEHARKHNVSHNEALKTPVEQIEGWASFVAFYVHVCRMYKDSMWGYVELDLGGTYQKIKTRSYLEGLGLKPIPVWHPLQDGLDYGEMLMQNYDRICLGNLVKSDEDTRQTVLRAMAKVKGRKYTTWVHALGLAIVPFALSYPINSLDAMTWMAAMMYPKRQTYSLLHKFDMDAPRIYDSRQLYFMGSAVLQKQVACNQDNWRSYQASKEKLYAHH